MLFPVQYMTRANKATGTALDTVHRQNHFLGLYDPAEHITTGYVGDHRNTLISNRSHREVSKVNRVQEGRTELSQATDAIFLFTIDTGAA